jgi:twitching motility protein PilT
MNNDKTLHIDRILEACVNMKGSDIHLKVGKPPIIRVNGDFEPLPTEIITPDLATSLMKSITPEKNQQELQEDGGTDFGFSFGEECRFRTSVFKQRGSTSLVLRLIPNTLLSFDKIGLPKQCKELCNRERGLFLVTGPTGSGKTTTLASIINYINEHHGKHIITIEEPIEYFHKDKKSIITQREVGLDVQTFDEALRRSLRQDPDIILVGELRDLETISAAITAAETGHLVFGTLHTTGCEGTINRIIDAFPANQKEQIRVQLSTNLLAVLSQTLCKRNDEKGRIAAYEFMVINSAISNLIRDNKVFNIGSQIQTGKKQGMKLLNTHLMELANAGLISKSELKKKMKRT